MNRITSTAGRFTRDVACDFGPGDGLPHFACNLLIRRALLFNGRRDGRGDLERAINGAPISLIAVTRHVHPNALEPRGHSTPCVLVKKV
jgi:hypothetical protein